MKKILSEKVVLEEKLNMNQLINLHTYEKSYNGSIYILANHEVTPLGDLPRLVTFSLLTSTNCEIHFIVEGQKPNQALEDITTFLTPDTYHIAN
ncbi:hypothetical protein [Gracilibacillus kekensis]|uniref:Uncharacterized protein n=1 Tax=Gracilibacillus kekensis TaxID=1027249 RepID=A0A1M7IGZ3_9BACI|nr:hypothetical protein [Gracilibacillus kekensis]SHM39939.1 hypothetical protein SAMN05216179_0049 [Gracilibacillus kekensis]